MLQRLRYELFGPPTFIPLFNRTRNYSPHILFTPETIRPMDIYDAKSQYFETGRIYTVHNINDYEPELYYTSRITRLRPG